MYEWPFELGNIARHTSALYVSPLRHPHNSGWAVAILGDYEVPLVSATGKLTARADTSCGYAPLTTCSSMILKSYYRDESQTASNAIPSNAIKRSTIWNLRHGPARVKRPEA